MEEKMPISVVRIVQVGPHEGRRCCRILQNLSVRNLVVVVAVLGLQVCLGQSVTDERCFLQTGGSTASFFVKEDLKVGSLVGQMRIKGNLGQDINLTLTPNDGPLKLDRQDLILTQKLDKEGEQGPSSLNVDVTCYRLGASDPSFTIPVVVRVTDVNDNTPKFIGSPYQLNISELTMVGTRIFREIKAIDGDQPGPFSTVEYSIGENQFSEYVTFENPLEGSLVLAKHLDFENLQVLQIRIIAKDQGVPPNQNETILTINVQDADDQNPAFFYDRYDALLPKGNTEGQKLPVQPQELRAFDKDVGISSPIFYTFNGNTDEYKYFELNRNTGQIYITASIPETEFLQPVTLVVQATQFDNPDRYAVTTLTVTRGGIFDSDLQLLQSSYQLKVLENVPLNTVLVTLLTNKPASRKVHFEIDQTTLPGNEFSVSQKGDVILRKSLDFESSEFYSFLVNVNDGRKNDSATVNITVLNINDWDPRFRYPQYEYFLEEEEVFEGRILGKLDVHDGDKGDKVVLELRGPFARAFDINSQAELTIKDLRFLNFTDVHLIAVAKDSGTPPRESSVPVIVHLPNHKKSELRQKEEETFTLMVVFGLSLSLAFIIIISLVAYICQQKHKKSHHISVSSLSNSSGSSEGNYNNNDLKIYGIPGPEMPYSYAVIPGSTTSPMGPIQVATNGHPTANGSSYTLVGSSSFETLGSTEVAINPLNPLNPLNRSNRRYGARLPRMDQQLPNPSFHQVGLPKIPNPSQNGNFATVSTTQRGSADNILQARSHDRYPPQHLTLTNSDGDLVRIQWPRNSISRRVKKLSWEDENDPGHDRDISTLMTDTNVSMQTSPDEGSVSSRPSEPQISGRAIYF